MTTVAELLVRRLESRGITIVFGLPGVDNLAFFDALERSSIRCVLVRHEATAGFAADAWFRVTGSPAVCFTTAGPGAANALTPMGEAWASGSTFLHMTTAVSSAYGLPLPARGLPHYHPYQLEQFRLLASAAVHCADPGSAANSLDDVLDAMMRPPYKPGYFEIPSDLLATEVDASDLAKSWPVTVPDSWTRPNELTATDVDALVERAGLLLGAAARPVVWAGSGAVSAAGAVLSLAEALGAPVLVTHSAKRNFRNAEHPLVVPYPPHEPPVAELIEASDVALVLGSDLDAMMTLQFSLALPSAVIQVDIERAHIGMQYGVEVAVVDSVDHFVSKLLACRERWEKPGRQPAGLARALAARLETERGLADDAANASALRLLASLDAALPTDAIVVCDMSVAGYWAAGLLDLRADRRLLYPIGWGTLGFGIPAAIGASLADHPSRVLCIAGDAGAAYALGDLATMVQEHLPITLLVVDDGGYGMLRYAARQRFGRTIASDLAAPDFAAVGRAFDLPSWSAHVDDEDLPDIMNKAVSCEGPSMVHLRATLNPPRMALLGSPVRRGTPGPR